ncbi:hypothetical protein FRC12_009066 [Ceratobasidium sp. 428]|nr:hypothetical protein FRC12_009066 [Ceratobasidium sp. 428]
MTPPAQMTSGSARPVPPAFPADLPIPTQTDTSLIQPTPLPPSKRVKPKMRTLPPASVAGTGSGASPVTLVPGTPEGQTSASDRRARIEQTPMPDTQSSLASRVHPTDPGDVSIDTDSDTRVADWLNRPNTQPTQVQTQQSSYDVQSFSHDIQIDDPELNIGQARPEPEAGEKRARNSNDSSASGRPDSSCPRLDLPSTQSSEVPLFPPSGRPARSPSPDPSPPRSVTRASTSASQPAIERSGLNALRNSLRAGRPQPGQKGGQSSRR